MKAHTVERQPPSSLKPGALVSRAKNDMSGVNSGNQICTPPKKKKTIRLPRAGNRHVKRTTPQTNI